MKICYWTPNAGGGAGKYEYYLPKEIKKLGVEVKVFRRPNGLKGNPVTLRLFYKSGEGITHATSQTLSVYSYPKPNKFIVTVHDIYSLHKSLISRVKRLLLKKTLKRADVVIAVSNFTKNEIIEQIGIDKENIKIIYMGVDSSLYRPLNKEHCKSRLHLNIEEKHILVISSNLPHKRMDIVMAVFNKIKNCRDDIKLLKAGYGSKLKGENIVNMGFLPEREMPILYNAADVLLHPSEYEGFGMPLLEAMACGIPIVASNKAAIPEVVGNCGELVNLNSEDYIDQFVEKILDCIDKRRNWKAMRRSKEFSWEKIARETIKVYEEVL